MEARLPRPPGLVLLVALVTACASSSAPSPPAPASAPPPAVAPTAAPAAAASSAPPALASMTVARAAVSPNVAPLWLAEDLGFFTQQGLDVQETQLRTAAAVEAALVAKDIQLGLTGLAAALTARAGGSDVVITGGYLDAALAKLMVRPDVVEPTDLRGRTLGVQSIGGTVYIRGMLALQKLGLDAERDRIQVIQAGDDPTMTQALIAGAVDAVPISYTSAAVAEANGMHGWDLADLGVPEIGQTAITTGAIAREQADVIERFLKGLATGVHYLKSMRADAAKRERALQLVAGKLGTTPDAVAAEMDKLAEVARPNLTPDPAALTAVRAAVVAETPAAAQVALGDILDRQFIQKLQREGFFDRLAASP